MSSRSRELSLVLESEQNRQIVDFFRTWGNLLVVLFYVLFGLFRFIDADERTALGHTLLLQGDE